MHNCRKDLPAITPGSRLTGLLLFRGVRRGGLQRTTARPLTRLFRVSIFDPYLHYVLHDIVHSYIPVAWYSWSHAAHEQDSGAWPSGPPTDPAPLRPRHPHRPHPRTASPRRPESVQRALLASSRRLSYAATRCRRRIAAPCYRLPHRRTPPSPADPALRSRKAEHTAPLTAPHSSGHSSVFTDRFPFLLPFRFGARLAAASANSGGISYTIHRRAFCSPRTALAPTSEHTPSAHPQAYASMSSHGTSQPSSISIIFFMFGGSLNAKTWPSTAERAIAAYFLRLEAAQVRAVPNCVPALPPVYTLSEPSAPSAPKPAGDARGVVPVRRASLCESVRERAGACGSVRERAGLSVRERAGACESVRERAGACESVRERARACESVRAHIRSA